jgi:predicted transcriptional regulator
MTMNTLAAQLVKADQVLAEAKAELAAWEKLSNRDPMVRESKASLIAVIMRTKQIQAILQNKLENKRADLQAREFEAMNRYERGLVS